ncbi:hypothetical protein IFR05_006479 [Cadophora sp. M221]|nr:hypothetical protein IFR05_006479 [Cadophora sp. M221]
MSSHKSPTTEPPQEEAECKIVSLGAQALNGHTKDTTKDSKVQDTKEEQFAVEAQLLLLDSAGSIVQISSDQLSKLLASMNELRGQVAALNADAQVLRTQHIQVTESLSDIENRHGCIEFLAIFPSDYKYFIVFARPMEHRALYTHSPSSPDPLGPAIFCTKAVDTMFFQSDDRSVVVGEMVDQLEEFEALMNHPTIEKVAIEYMWSDFDTCHQYFGVAMEGFSKLRIKELVLVLGSKEACRNPNLTFTKPTEPPRDMLSLYYLNWAKREMGLNELKNFSWKQLEELHLKIITDLAQHYNDRRKELEDSGLDPDYDEETSERFGDPNEWTVTKVTYMEATTTVGVQCEPDYETDDD